MNWPPTPGMRYRVRESQGARRIDSFDERFVGHVCIAHRPWFRDTDDIWLFQFPDLPPGDDGTQEWTVTSNQAHQLGPDEITIKEIPV